MPYVYAYLRVSHNDSAASGISIDTQEKLFKDWYAYEKGAGRLPNHTLGPVGWMGGPDLDENGLVRRDHIGQYKRIDIERTDGVFADLAKSAFRHKFLARDAGIRLNMNLRDGDMIWFSKLDRSFRNTGDACAMEEAWRKRGITLVFYGSQIDTRTPMGLAMFQMGAVWAQLDSSIKSERIKEALAFQRSQGRPHAKGRRYGFRCTSIRDNTWVPDFDERRIIDGIVKARHSLKHPRVLAWTKVSDAIERQLAREENRPVRTLNSNPPRFWDYRRCETAYRQAVIEKGAWVKLPEGVTPIIRQRRPRRSKSV